MRIEDLTPYTYTKMKGLEDAIAVGWLEGGDLLDNILKRHINKVPTEVIKLLKEYEVENLCRGFHMCEYCDDYGTTRATGNGEIWVFKDDKLYIAPYLIIHYIEEHNYVPPDEFIDAVLNGFRPHSPGYKFRVDKIFRQWKSF